MLQLFLLLTLLTSGFCAGARTASYLFENDMPPRKAWQQNGGYCGEASLVAAALRYGQYASQYTLRELATDGRPQTQGRLLLELNAQSTAEKMKLRAVEWTGGENSVHFLSWIKTQVIKGYPVLMGVFANARLFADNASVYSESHEYDHIVSVCGIGSNHPSSPSYYPDDLILFSDGGLWSKGSEPFLFRYQFDRCLTRREETGLDRINVYSVPVGKKNHALAIEGILDPLNETVPVRLVPSSCTELPEITEGSSTPPAASDLLLAITITNLKPGAVYTLYKYDSFDKVPTSNFHQHKNKAVQSWQVTIRSGTTYKLTDTIRSDATAVYRAVKNTSEAPNA